MPHALRKIQGSSRSMEVLDLLGTEPIHGLVWGQTLMRRRRCLTRRVMLPQLFAVHKKVDSTNLTAAVQTFEGPLAFCPGVSRAGVLPDSPRRLLRRSSLRIIASAISRMDLRRCRLSRCMAFLTIDSPPNQGLFLIKFTEPLFLSTANHETSTHRNSNRACFLQ